MKPFIAQNKFQKLHLSRMV